MQFRIFPAFFDHPTRISFLHQEENEEIQLLLRQHPITNLPWILLSFSGVILPVIIIQLDALLALNALSTIPINYFLAGVILFYMIVAAYAIENFLSWYFNIYIITNIHIIDINFHYLLNRDITDSRLDDIQSVKAKILGLFQSIFRYGDVIVETAAKGEPINFVKVPNPDYVADKIRDLQELEERGVNAG